MMKLKKFLGLFSLFAWILMGLSPLAHAVGNTNLIDNSEESLRNTKLCPFVVFPTYEEGASSSDIATLYEGVLDSLEQDLEESNLSCGQPDSHGFINKGSCTADNKVVTEITESFGEEVTLDGEGQVMDLYRGECCIFGKVDANGNLLSCDESRTIYTSTFSACQSASSVRCQLRQWIISTTGIGTIKIYVKFLYTWGAGIVGFISVTVIIVSSIQIQISGANGDISAAKNRILQSFAGLALLFLSGILLFLVNPNFFG